MTETVTPAASTIIELFAEAVRQWSDRVAFRVRDGDTWRPVTFAEYGDAVRACAGGLIAAGVQPGEFGAVMSANRPEWHEADLGMVNAGVVSCPIYPTNAPSQVAYVLQHSESVVVFVSDEQQRAKIEQVRADCPALRLCVVFTAEGADGGFYVAWDEFLARGRAHLAEHPEDLPGAAQPGDLLGVIYTSGTTGPPKGTMLTHHTAVFTLASLDLVLAAGVDDRKVSFLPLSQVAERASSEYLPLQQGFEVWFNADVALLGEDFKAARPTIQFVVPRVLEKQYTGLRMMLDGLPAEQRESALRAIELGKQRTRAGQQGGELPAPLEAAWQQADQALFARLRAELGYDAIVALVSGAAPIAMELLEFFNAIGVRLVEVYGQTEDHGPTTINRIDHFKLGSVGYAIPGGARTSASAPAPWVSQAIVVGDRRRYVTALLTLDEAAVTQFAAQKSITHRSFAELTRHPDIVGLIEVHVAEVNADLSGAEQVKKFRILPEDFSVAAGTITPTLKIKRKPITDRYADLVEGMYHEPAAL